jgi:hypothetical protein
MSPVCMTNLFTDRTPRFPRRRSTTIPYRLQAHFGLLGHSDGIGHQSENVAHAPQQEERRSSSGSRSRDRPGVHRRSGLDRFREPAFQICSVDESWRLVRRPVYTLSQYEIMQMQILYIRHGCNDQDIPVAFLIMSLCELRNAILLRMQGALSSGASLVVSSATCCSWIPFPNS